MRYTDHHKFKASLGCIMGSKPTWATQWDIVSSKQTNKQTHTSSQAYTWWCNQEAKDTWEFQARQGHTGNLLVVDAS